MVTASLVAFFLFFPDSVKLPVCSPTLSVQTNNDGLLTSFAHTHLHRLPPLSLRARVAALYLGNVLNPADRPEEEEDHFFDDEYEDSVDEEEEDEDESFLKNAGV
ncbi:uncharacterized protein B0T23DRAFT_368883 [Neurospora hispaniola]|uniref:Uncharacterized protein n=1 Tax=Neurospora hispaniola TaxID=588809 RepID=A0AAJ0IEQ2_9PEZI|nr:hypothetical protein B0T23DRAFT_368883 [Neurospora hispaniola]